MANDMIYLSWIWLIILKNNIWSIFFVFFFSVYLNRNMNYIIYYINLIKIIIPFLGYIHILVCPVGQFDSVSMLYVMTDKCQHFLILNSYWNLDYVKQCISNFYLLSVSIKFRKLFVIHTLCCHLRIWTMS